MTFNATNFFRLIGILTIGFLMFLATLHRERRADAFRPNTFQNEESLQDGNGDDPQGRARWEWMRQRDPATGSIPRAIRKNELAFAATLPVRGGQPPQFKRQGRTLQPQLEAWNEQGPINIGGRTRALGVDLNNENVIIAGSVTGGIWRSADKGQTWARTTRPADLPSATCLRQDRRTGKRNNWYYGTGEFIGNSGSAAGAFYTGDGIFKSIDDGVTWTQLPSTVSGDVFFNSQFDFVWNIAVDPVNTVEDIVYAATYGGIYRSINGGDSWTRVMGGLSNIVSRFTDVAVTSTGVLYATMSEQTNRPDTSAAARGLWRSTDGVNWTNITPANWPIKYNRIVIGIAPSNENIVYFLAETPGAGFHTNYAGGDEWTSFWKYTYVSGSGAGTGGVWENRSVNLPHFGQPVGDFASQGSYDLVVAVKPDNPDQVFIGGTNLYRSTTAFADSTHTTWIGGYATANDISQFTNHHPDQHALVFLPSSPATLLSGHDGGISMTNDALAPSVVWTSLNNGYYSTQFYAVAIDHATSGNPIIIGGMQDNGCAFGNAAAGPWVAEFGGDGGFCAIAGNRTSYYMEVQNANIFRFILDDNGAMSKFTNVQPAGGSGYLFINPYLLDPNYTDRMYLAGGQIVWRNNNLTGIPLGSYNATKVNWDSLSSTRISNDQITALGISTTPANRLYYGTSLGKVYRLDGANIGNPQPANITGAAFPSGGYVNCIAVDPANADRAIVVFSNYSVISLYATADGGANWTAVAGNLEQRPDGTGSGPSCRWASILSRAGKTTFFVGTSTGLYSTDTLNGAATIWAQEGASTIGNVVVDMIDIRQSDGLVVVGTHGNGVFSAVYGGNSSTEVLLSYDRGAPETGIFEDGANTDVVLAGRLTAPSKDVKIAKILLYYVGDGVSSDGSFFPVIYPSDSANNRRPALTPMYTGPSYIPTLGWDTIDVSGANLSLSRTAGPDFYVGVKYNGSTAPAIGVDTSVSNGRGWQFDPGTQTWTPLDSLSPPYPVSMYIRATVVLQSTGVQIPLSTAPAEFSLMQNYPNPFNPATTIRFDLPVSAVVTLSIYNILGQEVLRLFDHASLAAGQRQAQFEGSNLPSGVYFYRLAAEPVAGANAQSKSFRPFTSSRKMLLLK